MNAAGKPTESEGNWFKRALTEADKRVSLAPFAPTGSANPVHDLYDEFYVRTRTALFHAKGSRPSFLPHSPGQEREEVNAAISRLSRLYMALAEKDLGTHSSMSGLFAPGFDMMTKHLIPKTRLQATDDKAAADPAAEVLNPSGGVVVDLGTRHAPEMERPFIRAFLGTAKAADLSKLARLAVIAAKMDDKLFAYGSVDGELILSRVERLEGQLSVRQRNLQQPKSYFAS